MTDDALTDAKAQLRQEMRTRRAREARQMSKAGEAVAYRFPRALMSQGVSVAAGYAPINDEIEPGGVMSMLLHGGAQLALPCMVGRDQPLVFRAFSFGDPLRKVGFGVLEPLEDAAELRPDLVLAPLLAYDLFGGRLGYGGGYYDRTLAALRAQGPVIAVGLAYEINRVERVPMGPADQRLDWIVTEAASYEVAQSAKD